MKYYRSTLLSTHIDNFEVILNETKAIKKKKKESMKPTLLMLNSGCHDLSYNSSATYITEFYYFLDVVTKMQATGMFKIVFQNIPPWPHNMEFNAKRHSNMFIVAAVNRWVSMQLSFLEIPNVDLRGLALPFEDSSNCTIHFICQGKPMEPTGHAGREATYQALQHVCRDFV